jgi:hypothetical protein
MIYAMVQPRNGSFPRRGDGMKSKPNIDALLEGGAATDRQAKAMTNPRTEPTAAAPTGFRKQMVMQLPVALINDLKRRALEQSVSSGKRVTQQLLVEEALKKYLYS